MKDQHAQERETRKAKKVVMTHTERAWVGYDIGNSAFTLMVSTIFPIYFNVLAEAGGLSPSLALAYFGYSASITTLVVAILGPILGAMADVRGQKKKLFGLVSGFGIVMMLALLLPLSWFQFLVFFIFSRIGYQASLVLYDAMLTDVTSEERMNQISSMGYAMGYIGSTLPFILSLMILLLGDRLGLSLHARMNGAILINAAWWLFFTVRLYRSFEQRYYTRTQMDAVSHIFRRLGQTILDIRHYRRAFVFLLAFFFYIDGVYTMISMAVAYGKSIGLDSTQLLLALLVTQLVAFPFAILFGRLADRYRTGRLISLCIFAYTLITLFAVQLDQVWEFWFLAICVGIFQGGIQALSRAYFAKIIPPEKSGEYFGIYDIFGKGASLTGTTLIAVISQLTGHQSLGILALVVLFLIGFFLFLRADRMKNTPAA